MSRYTLTVIVVATGLGLSMGLIGAWYSTPKPGQRVAGPASGPRVTAPKAGKQVPAASTPAPAVAPALPVAPTTTVPADSTPVRDAAQEQWLVNRLATEADAAAIAASLGDPSEPVRRAALAAVTRTGVASDAVRMALLTVARHETEPRELRLGAIKALERFPLAGEEKAMYENARQRVGP